MLALVACESNVRKSVASSVKVVHAGIVSRHGLPTALRLFGLFGHRLLGIGHQLRIGTGVFTLSALLRLPELAFALYLFSLSLGDRWSCTSHDVSLP